jgi:hypothetical protein
MAWPKPSPDSRSAEGIDLVHEHIGNRIDGTKQRKDAITVFARQFAILPPLEGGVGKPLTGLGVELVIQALALRLLVWSDTTR